MNLRLPLIGLFVGIAGVARCENSARIEKPLVTVSDPPLVQMLVPGFSARELPLKLNNINNLVFAPDGRLFALCYDGNVFQLKDSDGDGLEDTATLFYKNDKNEIPPSIGMCWGRDGLYIASQKRVIHLRDRGDGTAELETVTDGWVPPTGMAGSNLDSVGIAVNKDGEIFFGLGCDNWHEAYRVDKQTGKSDYNLHSERGTILRISSDWKKREVICTGIRFSVSLAFNAVSDLFCTDQEGATWLPNGNPFDELLHIQPGRHYGFPPRHPKYLPDVIDEPSTFDFAPQHQSTCGLHFNDGKKVFGPEWWRGDAFVAGESRGKIWRVKLVKTAAGYVAKSDLIACLSMLTIDAVPTPNGDLMVACHSGKPDWGTGPQGKGKLFKISYSDKAAAQPLLTYAPSSSERRVVFDRELKAMKENANQFTVGMGKYMVAGERFESFRPGYQVVKNQKTMPRFELPVTTARVDKANHTVTVQTGGADEAINYALTIPDSASGNGKTIDVLADLTGIEAHWKSAQSSENWSGWLPHLDLAAARGFTKGSAEHERAFRLLEKRGSLTLRGQIDLWSMLHPAVQPDAKLDYEYPAETVTLVLRSKGELEVTAGTNVVNRSKDEMRITIQPTPYRWLPVEIKIPTGDGVPQLDVSWFTAEDARMRPLPLRRVMLPWAKPYIAVAVTQHTPELDGGDWERGRKVFFGEQVACFKCHSVQGEGGEIGPNLSNLIYRDYASVLKDITEPSAAISPDHISYNITLKNGESETGVLVKRNSEQVVIGDVNGKEIKIPRDNIANMKASAISLMPEGLLKGLNEQQQKDLLTFLLTSAPEKR